MFSLLKAVMAFALLCALVFTVFLVDVGGQSVASHVDDIWSSAVVQDKIAAIRDDVRVQLEAELNRSKADGVGEISEEDRARLESLLRSKAD